MRKFKKIIFPDGSKVVEGSKDTIIIQSPGGGVSTYRRVGHTDKITEQLPGRFAVHAIFPDRGEKPTDCLPRAGAWWEVDIRNVRSADITGPSVKFLCRVFPFIRTEEHLVVWDQKVSPLLTEDFKARYPRS